MLIAAFPMGLSQGPMLNERMTEDYLVDIATSGE
jgi:hypothetical protein